MNGFFNMDGPVWQALGRLADLVILNLLFIISCIPIVTIGAATTALYSITLKMARNEESYIVKGYWKAFKENFKQSTIMWLVMLVAGIILYMDIKIVTSTTTSASKIYLILLLAITLILAMGIIYI
ncbi:MAG: YesL family protein, partial [Muricoprocola sp.]